MVAQRLRDYELVMVLSPEADEDEVAATVDRVSKLISERGGTVSDLETWGVRRLAYPIRRFQEGHYLLTRFALDASDVLELDRSLNGSEDVLRYLVTRVDKSDHKAEPNKQAD